MSLTISISTQEGIVLAADSRQTYRNVVGAARIGSDSATKIFSVHEKIGVTVAGPAFLLDPNLKGQIKGIGSYIKEIIDEVSKADTVEMVTDKLMTRLDSIYNPKAQLIEAEKQLEMQITAMGGKIVGKGKAPDNVTLLVDYTDKNGKSQKAATGVAPIVLIVGGYDRTGCNVFTVNIPGEKYHKRVAKTPNQYGADWTGQTDLITRVILGFDPRIEGLELFQEAYKSKGQKARESLKGLEYIINWGAMTLNDAIDFAKLMIKTTSAVQRFSDGINMAPGDMPGVGGPVDVAVILPDRGFHWVQRKVLPLEKPTL